MVLTLEIDVSVPRLLAGIGERVEEGEEEEGGEEGEEREGGEEGEEREGEERDKLSNGQGRRR